MGLLGGVERDEDGAAQATRGDARERVGGSGTGAEAEEAEAAAGVVVEVSEEADVPALDEVGAAGGVGGVAWILRR